MKLKYEDKLKIIEMKQQGYPNAEICDFFNIKKNSIYRVVKAYSLHVQRWSIASYKI